LLRPASANGAVEDLVAHPSHVKHFFESERRHGYRLAYSLHHQAPSLQKGLISPQKHFDSQERFGRRSTPALAVSVFPSLVEVQLQHSYESGQMWSVDWGEVVCRLPVPALAEAQALDYGDWLAPLTELIGAELVATVETAHRDRLALLQAEARFDRLFELFYARAADGNPHRPGTDVAFYELRASEPEGEYLAWTVLVIAPGRLAMHRTHPPHHRRDDIGSWHFARGIEAPLGAVEECFGLEIAQTCEWFFATKAP
jgi:hypothetical protein